MPYLFLLLNDKNYNLLSYKKHFFTGFVYGLGFFAIYLEWIKEPFLLDNLTKQYSIFSYLLIVYCSLYFGIIFFILKFIKNKIIKLISLPSLIVLAEFISANFSYGFSWFSFSLVHSSNLVGTSLIYYLGTYGLSYLTLLIFFAPSILLIENFKYRNLFINIYFIMLILLIIVVVSRSIRADNTNKIEKSISLVQLNYQSNQYLNNENLLKKNSEIINIIKRNQSDIVVFGENDFPFIMDDNNIRLLQKNIKEEQIVIIGATRKENKQYYNSLFLVDKNKFQIFDKKILVPFGEFIPLRSFFNFMEFIAGTIDFTIGQNKRIFNVSNKLKILPIICYEITYFWKLIDSDNHDSNLIINLTNDSWFGTFSGPYQHFYFAKLRAAEFNKTLIRTSNSGVSAVINRYGEVIDYIELNQKKIQTLKVEISENKTNYLIIHKFIIIFNFIFLFLCLLINKNNEYRKI